MRPGLRRCFCHHDQGLLPQPLAGRHEWAARHGEWGEYRAQPSSKRQLRNSPREQELSEYSMDLTVIVSL